MPQALVLLLVFWSLLSPDTGRAQQAHCPALPVVEVTAEYPEQITEICLAAEKALSFLSRYNLKPQRKISFTIVEEKINNRGYEAFGSYDSRSDQIQLMSYAAIMKGAEHPMMYGEPFDPVHYRGAIAHEVAHAVVQHNLKFKPISPGPQEYLAHSTQLSALPPVRREAIIKAMDVEPWESGDVISDIYMALEPGKFAVKSYKHLKSLSDPTSFVEILLNSKWFYVYVP
jgi:hypothetical protein